MDEFDHEATYSPQDNKLRLYFAYNCPFLKPVVEDPIDSRYIDFCMDGIEFQISKAEPSRRFIIGATVSLWAKRARMDIIPHCCGESDFQKYLDLESIDHQAEAFALKGQS